MNATLTKERYSEDELNALRRRVLDYKQLTNESWGAIAAVTGIGESTIQAFANAKYNGDNQAKAAEVEKWFKSNETMKLFSDIPLVPGYQPTPTALRVRANLLWARGGKIVTIEGDPGVGKTIPLENFVWEFPNTWMITASPSRSGYTSLLQSVLKQFNVPPSNRSTFQLSELVRRQFSSRENGLLLIDEAQHVAEKALEELRSIHDETKVGIAFVGNREVTRNIEGPRTANFAQRFSRISMRMIIDAPDKRDVNALLEIWRVTDSREQAFLTSIAMRPGGGALRSLTKCLELASVLADGAKEARTLVHLKDAWAQLSAGGVA